MSSGSRLLPMRSHLGRRHAPLLHCPNRCLRPLRGSRPSTFRDIDGGDQLVAGCPPCGGIPWVKVERRTRAILADRLSFGASRTVDAALSKVIAERRRVALEGWFN